MKNMNTKKIMKWMLIAVTACSSVTGNTQENQFNNNSLPSLETIVDDLSNMHLKSNVLNSAGDLSMPKYFSEERKVLLGLSKWSPPTQEGIPGTHALPDPKELVKTAYTPARMIERALENVSTLPMGERVLAFETWSKRIIERSGANPAEQAVRITLNRAVDISNGIIKVLVHDKSVSEGKSVGEVASRVYELAASYLVNFYVANFQLALSYANNPCILTAQGLTDVSESLSQVSLAEFGRVYSTLLFRFSNSLAMSDTAKAIMLIKLTGYLGWDFNLDLRRREDGLKEILADIYLLQTEDPTYDNILSGLKNRIPPTQSALAQLRSKINLILIRVPDALKSAGIR